MKTAILKTTTLMILSTISLINKINAIDGTGNITSGGINRTFTYHAQGASIGTNLPVMIVMHGDGGTGASIQSFSGFDAVADANNVLAIYPDAVSGAWNRYVDTIPGDAGLGNLGAPDDVLFISDLIDYLCTTYQINPNKVYASGHSAGGFMAYNLSIQLNDKIAAFGPVSANLWGDNTYLTNYFTSSYIPVPIVHIHGDADFAVNYPDPDFTPIAYNEYPLFAYSQPNCGSTTYGTVTPIVAGVESIIFCDGTLSPFMKIELVRVMGLAHAWPATAGFDVATYIWSFCNQYSLTTGVICTSTAGTENENPLDKLSLYPIPVVNQLNIVGELPQNSKVEIMDGLGKVVYSQKDFTQSNIQVSNLAKGVYFLTIHSGNNSRQIKFIKN